MAVENLKKIRKNVKERNKLNKKSKKSEEDYSTIKQLENDIENLKVDLEPLIITVKDINVSKIDDSVISKINDNYITLNNKNTIIDKKYLKTVKVKTSQDKEKKEIYLYVYHYFIEKYYYEGNDSNSVIADIQLTGIKINVNTIFKTLGKIIE